jgi:hypothetical protein
MFNFDEDEVMSIKIVTRILGGMSLAGSFCVFFLFWFFKNIRTFALELVLWLSITNSLFIIQYFFPIGKEPDMWCKAQVILSGTFNLSSLVWTTIIGYTALISIHNYDHVIQHKTKYRVIYFMIGNMLPLAIFLV